MSRSEMARGAIGSLIVIAAVGSLIIRPASVQVVMIFAAIGIVGGALLSLRGTLAGLAGATALILGTEWAQSMLAKRGFETAWYTPILVSAAFAVIAYFIGQVVRARAKTSLA